MKKAIVLTGIIVVVLALTVSARGFGLGLRDGSCFSNSDNDFTSGTRVMQGQRNGNGNRNGNRKGNRNTSGCYNSTGNRNAQGQGQGNGLKRQSRLFYSDEKVRDASIIKYDVDNNGTLDQTELLKMREEHNDLKDQFDSDKDGRLSDEEFDAYKDALYKELGIE
jgi:hypothetical protein